MALFLSLHTNISTLSGRQIICAFRAAGRERERGRARGCACEQKSHCKHNCGRPWQFLNVFYMWRVSVWDGSPPIQRYFKNAGIPVQDSTVGFTYNQQGCRGLFGAKGNTCGNMWCAKWSYYGYRIQAIGDLTTRVSVAAKRFININKGGNLSKNHSAHSCDLIAVAPTYAKQTSRSIGILGDKSASGEKGRVARRERGMEGGRVYRDQSRWSWDRRRRASSRAPAASRTVSCPISWNPKSQKKSRQPQLVASILFASHASDVCEMFKSLGTPIHIIHSAECLWDDSSMCVTCLNQMCHITFVRDRTWERARLGISGIGRRVYVYNMNMSITCIWYVYVRGMHVYACTRICVHDKTWERA